MNRAYSYIRWSSKRQTHGDSLRRQIQLAEDYARKHDLQLDSSTFQDHGISAFRGKNLVEGKLGTFLKAIDDGVIKTPCYLLVEALDRISRGDIASALRLFLDIIDRGVTLVVLQEEQTFSPASIKGADGLGQLQGALHVLAHGHKESAKRGKRISAAWAGKHEKMRQGAIPTANCPSWLTVSADKKKYLVDKGKASIVKKIFKLHLAGNGCHRIAIMLNEQNVPTIGRRKRKHRDGTHIPVQHWSQSMVDGLLKEHAVYGRYKPVSGLADIPDWYPAIISKEDYDQAATKRRNHKQTGGWNQGTSNLFSGITVCAYCRGKMKSGGGGKQQRPEIKMTLRCRTAVEHGGCDGGIMPYGPMESDVLSYLVAWARRDLTAHKMEETTTALRRQFEQQLDVKKEEHKRLVDIVQFVKADEDIVRRIKLVQTEIEKLEGELVSLQGMKLSDKEISDNVEMLAELVNENTKEMRLSVQVRLREMIETIEVAPFIEKHPQVWDNFELNGKVKGPLHMVKINYKDGSTAITDVLVG